MISVDEPRYAWVGREMARSGDWITPRLWGSPWFEKPALLYWLIAGANKAGLRDEWAARLPVALLSLAFLAFYFDRLRKLFDFRVAAHATAILATSAGWIGFSRAAVTDIPLAATFGAAMLLAIPWAISSDRSGLRAGGVLIGLALLAKGLLPLVLLLPLLWIGRSRWRDLLLPGIIALAVAAPWYLLCTLANGTEFPRVFFVEHHFGRFFSGALLHGRAWWFYVPVLLAGLAPWTPLIPSLARKENLADPRLRVFLAWAAFGFLFFSVGENKLPGYLLPLLPAIAAILGFHASRRQRPVWMVPCSVALVALAVPLLAEVIPGALDEGLGRTGIRFRLTPYLVAVIPVVWLEWRGLRDHAFAAAVVGVLAGLAVSLPPASAEIDERTARRVWLEQVVPRRDRVCLDPGIRRTLRYGLDYYSVVPLPECEDGDSRFRIMSK
jgi:4-amino-4-deoxy-L-arabinose transferase-like glycosyltransferase